MPKFLLQIVDAETGILARFPAGTKAGLERPLIEACTQAIVTAVMGDVVRACTAAIVAQGVGYFTSEAKVEQAITDGLAAILPGQIAAAVDTGITQTVRALKHETTYLT